jgi:archaellum component FlaC
MTETPATQYNLRHPKKYPLAVERETYSSPTSSSSTVSTRKPSPDREPPRSPLLSNQTCPNPNPSESTFVGTLLLEIFNSKDLNLSGPTTQPSLIAQFSSSFLEYLGLRSKDLMPPETQSQHEQSGSPSGLNSPYESSLIAPSIPRTESATTDERVRRMDVERAALLKSVQRKIEFGGRAGNHHEGDEVSDDLAGSPKKRNISELVDLDSFRPLSAMTETAVNTVKKQFEELHQSCKAEFACHTTGLNSMSSALTQHSTQLTMIEERLNAITAECVTFSGDVDKAVKTNTEDVQTLGEGLKLTRDELKETCDSLTTLNAKVEELPSGWTLDQLVATVSDMSKQVQHLTRASNVCNENFSMHLKGIESLADRCNNIENGMAELTETLKSLNRKLFDADGSVSRMLAMYILTSFDEDLITRYESHKRPRLD